MRSQALKGHLDLLLLAALRSEPAHGYLLVQRLAVMSGGEFDLPEGTIYPALHRLEAARLVRSRSFVHRGRTRRVYEMTAAGERALAGERAEWERFAAGVMRTLEASG